MFIQGCVVVLISCSIVVISSQSLSRVENSDDSVNFPLVENVCPDRNRMVKTSDFLRHHQGQDAGENGTIYCVADEQCKIGSKCCPVDELHSACVDLIDMSLSKSKRLTAASFRRHRRSRKPRIFFWKTFFPADFKSRPCTQKCTTNDDCFEFKGGARKAVYNCVYSSYYPYKCSRCQYAFSFPPGGVSFSNKVRK